jgi:hypothetical protein
MDAPIHHCGARTRSGQPCKNAKMPNGRCRLHGGKTPSGPASPHWRDGRRSKVLPKRLLAAYQASLADPHKLELDDEIALLDTRLMDLLGRIDNGESGQLWTALRQAWRDYEAARKAKDTVALTQAITTVGELITRGHMDAAAWSEARQIVQERRRVVESERKYLIESQQVVAVDQAWGLMALLIDAVRMHVRDDDTLRKITEEYSRLMGRPVPEQEPPPVTGGPRWNA